MGRIYQESMKENIKKSLEEEVNNQLSNGVTPRVGDVIWVKIKGSSWWPAQVFDVDSVSARCKPRKKANGEILVRLYGSYKYLYVDWVTAQSEFVTKLEENNWKYNDILLETLEKDLSCIKSGTSKRQRAETKASGTKSKSGSAHSQQTDETRSRKRKQGMDKKPEQNGKEYAPTTDKNSQDQRSSRKVRVMQSLGLIAPPGSPFRPKYLNSSPGKKVEHGEKMEIAGGGVV